MFCSRSGKPDSVYRTHLSMPTALSPWDNPIGNASNTVNIGGCGGEDCPQATRKRALDPLGVSSGVTQLVSVTLTVHST